MAAVVGTSCGSTRATHIATGLACQQPLQHTTRLKQATKNANMLLLCLAFCCPFAMPSCCLLTRKPYMSCTLHSSIIVIVLGWDVVPGSAGRSGVQDRA